MGQTKTKGASIAMVHSVPELVVSEQVRRDTPVQVLFTTLEDQFRIHTDSIKFCS